MMVSVSCITFNHVGLIRKALDGFVNQVTNFPYEVWIHDDKSTDGTIEILQEYEKKYPNFVHVLYEEENQYSKGKSLSEILRPYLSGKYIAKCEGDDYWTDPHKLQKQVDFLESHPDVSLCVHACERVNLVTGEKVIQPSAIRESRYCTMDELIEAGGGYFPTCSMVFRSDINYVPYKWGKGLPGDYAYLLQCGLKGKVFFMCDCMGVKTDLYPGSWTARHKDLQKMKKFYEGVLTALDHFDGDTQSQFNEAVEKKKMITRYRISCEIDGNYRLLFEDRAFRAFYQQMPFQKKVKCAVRAYAPWLISLLKRSKG